ncbi:unnamed protein product [Pocillopora meandrina]|uniref:Uncharacterized protein n=1 Tax=Pocillopora meandrina TaxID=46732 RepID=A0AAU9XXD7_9CNID|nr:unnamed protein product [Pocillopora meandrina]
MHQRLRVDYGLVISRETYNSRKSLLESSGSSTFERRSRHRLKRRPYFDKGPNFVWHLDGYENLSLSDGSSNNNPRIVARYYLDCLTEVGGVR